MLCHAVKIGILSVIEFASYISIGTGLAGTVLARPLFRTMSFKKFNIATCNTRVCTTEIATQCTNEQTINYNYNLRFAHYI